MWGRGGIWSLRLRAAFALAAHYRSMADKALAEKDHARWLRTAGRRSTFLQGFGEAAESVLYTFDLLMLRGKDVRSWAIEERRGRLLEIAQQLPPSIRYSETFDAPLPELIKAVRQHQLEGIVAKRVGSPYRSGERCRDWLKWRADRGQELVIGGYIPNDRVVDSILVGYYQEGHLMYAGRV
jgi:bifunctional non-homologous end joining protein LigD